MPLALSRSVMSWSARLALGVWLALPAALVRAETTDFDFDDPKGINALAIQLDSELEPIVAIAGGVAGVIAYDPADPTSFAGELSIPVSGITFANPGMGRALQGANWLDAEKYGQIKFVFDQVQGTATPVDGVAQIVVPGKIVYGELEIPKVVSLEVHHLPDAAAKRGGAESGDLLVLRSTFTVTREDFNLQPDVPVEKVSNEIQITALIAGYSE